jgi:hypothetical protein
MSRTHATSLLRKAAITLCAFWGLWDVRAAPQLNKRRLEALGILLDGL